MGKFIALNHEPLGIGYVFRGEDGAFFMYEPIVGVTECEKGLEYIVGTKRDEPFLGTLLEYRDWVKELALEHGYEILRHEFGSISMLKELDAEFEEMYQRRIERQNP